jgi:hypothetical protein
VKSAYPHRGQDSADYLLIVVNEEDGGLHGSIYRGSGWSACIRKA